MGTTVCLVRHGETDWNRQHRLQGREDTELNEQGREQAELTAEFLAQQDWDLIVTSPLKRAAQTARIIARRLGDMEPIAMPELVERDYGAASGLTPDQMKEAFPDGHIPGIEDRAEVRARATRALQGLIEEHPGKHILVVSHGGLINSMLAAVSNGEIGTGKTVLGNACLSVLRFSEDRWEIHSHNVTDHLEVMRERAS